MTDYAVMPLDSAQARSVLMTDENYAAYALADLEPPYAAHAVWVGACCDGVLEALALHYTGLAPQVLFLIGSHAGIEALLQAPPHPRQVYYTAKPDVKPILRRHFRLVDLFHMFRMRLDHTRFVTVAATQRNTGRFIPLKASQADDIRQLQYETSQLDLREFHEIAFAPSMVEDGYYFGQFHEGQLVAAAGTHLVARSSGIAAVGNVVVHPAHRGTGLGTEATFAVTKALIDDGFHLIVLNVRQDNLPATHIYERLGFVHTGAFIEGLAERL